MGVLCCCCCCCNNFQTKTLEIIQLVIQSFCFFFLFCSLCIIKWSKISVANLLLFILMLIITIVIIVFTSFLRYWRAKNVIKTTKKAIGLKLASISFALIIICFIICIIEESVFIISIRKANYPCLDKNFNDNYGQSGYYYKVKYNNTKNVQNIRNLANDYDCTDLYSNFYVNAITTAQVLIAYLTFCFLELSFFIGVWIWYILRQRIIQGLDGPTPLIGRQIVNDPYGRQVVVVQQGDVVIMDGQPHVAVPAQYQNYYQNNYQNNYQSYNQNYQNNNQYNNQNNNQNNNQINNQFNNINDSQNISEKVSNNQIPNSQEYLH